MKELQRPKQAISRTSGEKHAITEYSNWKNHNDESKQSVEPVFTWKQHWNKILISSP